MVILLTLKNYLMTFFQKQDLITEKKGLEIYKNICINMFLKMWHKK